MAIVDHPDAGIAPRLAPMSPQRWAAMTPAQQEAAAAIGELAESGERLILLTGPPGSGKSHLLQRMAADETAQRSSACLVDRGGRIGPEHLQDCEFLLVDEGQDLDERGRSLLAMRERLLMLPTLIATVDAETVPLPGPAARVRQVMLRRLNAEEAVAFALAAVPEDARHLAIDADAAEAIAAAGDGLPSRLRALMRCACLEATLEGGDRVTTEHARRAAHMLPGRAAETVDLLPAAAAPVEDGDEKDTSDALAETPPLAGWRHISEMQAPPPPAPRRWPTRLTLAGAVVLATAGTYFYLGDDLTIRAGAPDRAVEAVEAPVDPTSPAPVAERAEAVEGIATESLERAPGGLRERPTETEGEIPPAEAEAQADTEVMEAAPARSASEPPLSSGRFVLRPFGGGTARRLTPFHPPADSAVRAPRPFVPQRDRPSLSGQQSTVALPAPRAAPPPARAAPTAATEKDPSSTEATRDALDQLRSVRN